MGQEGDAPARTAAGRRALLEGAGHAIDKDRIPPGALAIAFSGGGIRSATLSLGVTQALAAEGHLLEFDYCSTVSGGGYCGSFLTSLFLPDYARGPTATTASGKDAETTLREDLAPKLELTLAALRAGSPADAPAQPAGDDTTDSHADAPTLPAHNPVWWLREHGRYLAPGGMTDYLQAAVYMMRNWMAVLYVLALPLAWAAFAAIALDRQIMKAMSGWWRTASPLWLVAAGGVALSIATGVSYWFTAAMTNRADYRPRSGRGPLAALAVASLVAILAVWALLWVLTGSLSPAAILHDRPADLSGAGAMVMAGVTLVAATTALVIGLSAFKYHGEAFTAEVRRRVTNWTTFLVLVTAVTAGAALIDTLAISGYDWLHPFNRLPLPSLSVGLVPLVAWIVHQATGLAGLSNRLTASLLRRAAPVLALAAGALIFVALAVVVHVGLQLLLFDGNLWFRPGPAVALSPATVGIAAILFLLTAITWISTGFANLSSLHNIYAARLTRAYLGASNLARLRETATGRSWILKSHPCDQIPIDVYQQTRHLGPLHLINVTLNETRSTNGSHLTERDRKGVPLVFAPEGVFVDAGRQPDAGAAISWSRFGSEQVERLSVGQLCAISGAAASTGMGARTTFGTALAFTMANIRLGYWWNVRGLLRPEGASDWRGRFFRLYFYLTSEMLARYTRDEGRVYLSDGGHFDNSGAYELLRRKDVRLIVVCDHGADPDYRFDDLENLVRKVRLDLGLSINVTAPEAVARLVGPDAAPFFLNGLDWRGIRPAFHPRRKKSRDTSKAVCLMLDVFDRKDDGKDGAPDPVKRILWLKPRIHAGLTQDILGYASAHPSFPNEWTGDQFFDEAQWESYRALGYCTMLDLIGALPGGKGARDFGALIPGTKAPPEAA